MLRTASHYLEIRGPRKWNTTTESLESFYKSPCHISIPDLFSDTDEYLRYLETQPESELQLARVERAASLSECGIGDFGRAQLEVSVVENVERFCAELQTPPLGEPEVSEDRSK